MRTLWRAVGSAFAVLLFVSVPAWADDVDCSKGAVPSGPLKGTINGAAFAADSVTFDGVGKRDQGGVTFDEYHFYLKDKGGAVLDMTAITPTGKLPDGKTFRYGLNGDEPEAGPGSPEIQGWSFNDESKNLEIGFWEVNDASLQIVFGNRSGDKLPARIHFCVPSRQSEIGGDFTIPLK